MRPSCAVPSRRVSRIGRRYQALDLNAVFDNYLGEIASTDDRRAFDLASMRFLEQFRNGHTFFSDDWLWRTHGGQLGCRARKIDSQWIVTATSQAALKLGVEIVSIDDEPFEDFFVRQKAMIGASSDRMAAELLFNRTYLFPSSFRLGIDGDDAVVIERPVRQVPADDGPHMTRIKQTSILRVPSFASAQFEASAVAMVRDLPSDEALIVDLRGNRGGDTPMGLLFALMDRPFRLWIEGTVHPGGRVHGRNPEMMRTGPETVEPEVGAFRGPMALLIDAGCLSAAEDFIAPFKDNHRAIIIGETTGGSSGQPIRLDFGDGMWAMIGAKRQWFPDGSAFEGVGIAPDIPISVTRDDVRAGADPVLQAALAQLER